MQAKNRRLWIPGAGRDCAPKSGSTAESITAHFRDPGLGDGKRDGEPEVINGDDLNNTLAGTDRAPTVRGERGNDEPCGDKDDDFVFGSRGIDTLQGGSYKIYGGSGDDFFG